MKKRRKYLITAAVILMMAALLSTTAFAASGDVSGAITDTWNSAKTQIKSVVDSVVFPAIDLILAILFFVKLGTAWFDCAPVKAM